MKVVNIVGARPQFIKAAPVSRALRAAGHTEVLVHTGQHYDYLMFQIFFEEMEIPAPDINLGVGSAPHGRQTGQMLELLEEVLAGEDPDWVIVYGDTNSTLAGALAACKLRAPLAHVEAGLRSFNREMPEEHNRVLTDHCADLLLCPTLTAVENLAREGITDGVEVVGDTMYDAVLRFAAVADERSTIMRELGLKPQEYLLATVHRAYNTDVPENLGKILSALCRLDWPVVFPVHPRTRRCIQELNCNSLLEKHAANVLMIEPLGYLDMLALEQNARIVLTDSGGIQKEAYFFGVPCVTLRPETEWIETVEAGWNTLAGVEPEQILAAVKKGPPCTGRPPDIFGSGDAALRIVAALEARGARTRATEALVG